MEKPKGHILRLKEAARLADVYLQTTDFNTEVEADFAKIPLPDLDAQIREMRALTSDGKVRVASVTRDEKRIGSFFYSVLELYGARTLWIVGVSCDDAFFEQDAPLLLPALGDEIRRLAREHACAYVRADTARPALFALLRRLGFLPGTVELYFRL